MTVTPQRRGRAIAMTPAEINAFLASERTCRVASLSAQGLPHVTALWFVWDGKALWLNSLVRSRRWADLRTNPAVSILVDTGHDFAELRGVELSGHAEPVGEVPRVGLAEPTLTEPEQLFARKYAGLDAVPHDGRHAWLRITPSRIVSWDYRKRAR
ncbi:pyridoxamine 5'-phosphate oxidase family protein [Dactylosporangium sp. NPDC005572]|uniref:pyridoxamine 5'-phosphate oxidase family protein n=1 Tax=Dactylosporangium sp. NPDC005572 TaxID=3156889 RepID=UPI0033B85720